MKPETVKVDTNKQTETTQKLFAKTIETDRIILTRLQEDAIPDMFEYGSMPEFYKNLDAKPFQSMEDCRKYFQRLMNLVESGALYWSIFYKKDHKIIGTGGVRNISDNNKRGECTLGISPLYHHSGIAVESFFLMHDYCFNVLGMEEIYGIVSSEHHSSIKMLDRLGYRNKGTLKHHFTKLDGRKYDAYNYVITPETFNENPDLRNYIENNNIKIINS